MRSSMRCPGVSSGFAPRAQILDAETGNVLKVPRIVRRHGQVIDKGCRPDKQIHIVDADALRPEDRPDASELFRAIGVEGNNADLVFE